MNLFARTANKVGPDPTFSRRFFSLTNQISNICFFPFAQTNSPSEKWALDQSRVFVSFKVASYIFLKNGRFQSDLDMNSGQ